MECHNGFDCRKPANLSVYFRQVPNSVWFLDHSMRTVLKKFNLTLLKVLKYTDVHFSCPPSIYETALKYRSYIRQTFLLKNIPK